MLKAAAVVYVNVLLTALFIYPLIGSTLKSSRLRNTCVKTLIAAAVSLTVSTINIAVLAVFKGHELGWACLGMCGIDVGVVVEFRYASLLIRLC